MKTISDSIAYKIWVDCQQVPQSNFARKQLSQGPCDSEESLAKVGEDLI